MNEGNAADGAEWKKNKLRASGRLNSDSVSVPTPHSSLAHRPRREIDFMRGGNHGGHHDGYHGVRRRTEVGVGVGLGVALGVGLVLI